MLAEQSAARVAKDPVLTKIASARRRAQGAQGRHRVPLAMTKWEDRRKQQKAELEAASPDLEKARRG